VILKRLLSAEARRRPSKTQWWLIWIGLGVAYFCIGLNLSSGSPPDRQLVVGFLSVALAALLVWASYLTLKK
jgi:hypothetical protein